MASQWVRTILCRLCSRPVLCAVLAVSLASIAVAGDAKPPVTEDPPAGKSASSPASGHGDYEQPVDYSRGTRVRLSGISVGAGVGFYNGPAWGPGWYGPGWYGPRMWNALWWDPWFASPYWSGWAMPASWIHPGYWGGFGQTPASGEIELRTPNKDDAVMIDGAFAGRAKDLKSFWLPPGIYVISVVDGDGNSFERKVYVLSGKTLRLTATLSPPDAEPAPATKPEAETR